SRIGEELGYPIACIGVPKAVDNDLALTDNCPGFGSVAKYDATSMREAGFDVASMHSTSTQVFVLDLMGRPAGWSTAASSHASESSDEAPQILLFPEITVDKAKFLARVERTVKRVGWCAIAVSEGLKDADGRFLAEAGTRDAFGHVQLGGVGPRIAQMITDELGYKNHWAVAEIG